jgi:hypothetical protein
VDAALITIGDEYTVPVVFVGSSPLIVYLIWSASACDKVSVDPLATSPAARENVGAAKTLSVE